MTIIETTKMTSKGQVTIPNRVRKILHLQEDSSVAFTMRFEFKPSFDRSIKSLPGSEQADVKEAAAQ